MNDDYHGDFLVADEKIEQGTDWTDTTTIPVAGDTLEFGFSLLDENVRQYVQSVLPLDELRASKQDVSEDQERFMELQRKDELTEEDREELVELAEALNPEEEGRETLGEDAVDALMEAGVHAIEPTEDDVTDVMEADPETQQQILGEIPDHLDRAVAREQLKEYMEERIQGQPFPIKFTLGQTAYVETMSVLGNGFQTT